MSPVFRKNPGVSLTTVQNEINSSSLTETFTSVANYQASSGIGGEVVQVIVAGTLFNVDRNDTSSSDDGGEILVNVDGLRIKRSRPEIEGSNFGSANATSLQASIDRAIALGTPLFLGSNDYVIDTTLQIPQDTNLTIVSFGASIDASSGVCFNITGGSLKILGDLTILNSSVAFRWATATDNTEMTFEIEGVKILNSTIYAFQANSSQGTSVKFTEFILRRVVCDGNSLDLIIQNIDLENVNVSGSVFINGGSESLNFQGGSNEGTTYLFQNNIWKNYTNSRPNPDADGHFIRCYGKKALIIGNEFSGLYTGPSTTGTDTEGLRPRCDEVVISGNLFEDAGQQEAFVALKGCNEVTVSNNRFRCTDSYNTAATTDGVYTIAILLGDNKCTIKDNTFENFIGSILDTEGDIDDIATVTIDNNEIIGCQTIGYSSSQLFRLIGSNTTYVVSNNRVAIGNSLALPGRIARLGGQGSKYYFNNNFWAGTLDNPYDNADPEDEVYSHGNVYYNFPRLLSGIDECALFDSRNDTFEITGATNTYNNWLSPNVRNLRLNIENLLIKYDAPTYNANRILGLQYEGGVDSIGDWSINAVYKESGGAGIAQHRLDLDWSSDGSTMTIVATNENTFYTVGTPAATAGTVNVTSNILAIRKPTEFSAASFEASVSLHAIRLN